MSANMQLHIVTPRSHSVVLACVLRSGVAPQSLKGLRDGLEGRCDTVKATFLMRSEHENNLLHLVILHIEGFTLRSHGLAMSVVH